MSEGWDDVEPTLELENDELGPDHDDDDEDDTGTWDEPEDDDDDE